jgi:hypothetical protein
MKLVTAILAFALIGALFTAVSLVDLLLHALQ